MLKAFKEYNNAIQKNKHLFYVFIQLFSLVRKIPVSKQVFKAL